MKWAAGQTHQDVFQHLAVLKGVTWLMLEDIELPSPASLASLLRAFPALVDLSCKQVRVHKYAKAGPTPSRNAELLLPMGGSGWCNQFNLHADDVSAGPLAIAIRHGRRVLFDIAVLFSTADIGITLSTLAASDVGSLLSALHGPRILSFRLNFDCRGMPTNLATKIIS